MSRHIVFVGRDIATYLGGDPIVELLRQDGYEVRTFFGRGKPLMAAQIDLRVAVDNADAVWVGMSSSAILAEPEIIAIKEAQERGTPYFLYADTYNCWGRSWFAFAREKAAGVFVLNDEEAVKARQIFPSSVPIIVSGNPDEERWCFPEISRDGVRARLGVPDGHFMILAAGTKSVPITSYLWMSVIQALHGTGFIEEGNVAHIFLAPHPGDETVQKGLAVYQDIVDFSGGIDVRFIHPDEMRTPDMVAGADLVIGSASSIARQASYLQIPAIEFFSEIALARLETTNNGSRLWEPCELGITYGIYGELDGLACAIYDLLLHTDEIEALRAVQRRKCPPPKERGAAAKTMAAALLAAI